MTSCTVSCLKQFISKRTLHNSMKIRGILKRNYLSDSYRCQDVWKERLSTSLLKDVDVSNFAMKIQESLDRTNYVTAIDMDILANVLEKIDPLQLDFVQNLFYRFRFTPDTIKTQESTSHAIMRALMDFGETERLLQILRDKENYGVFLDQFSANILLDHFLKQHMYKEAAEIAFDQMLQEDFSHPITKYLSWYACHKFWKNLPTNSPTQQEEKQDEDEEETLVLVNYIRPPWYDNHWDIPKDSMRIGKVFTMVTGMEDDTLSRSYKLIGYALRENYDQVLDQLQGWENSGCKECVAVETIKVVKTLLEELETKEHPKEEIDPGLLTIESVTPYVTLDQKQQYLQKYQELTNRLTGNSQLKNNFDLELELETKLKEVIRILEQADIKEQKKLYGNWGENRENLLASHIRKVTTEQRKKQIADRMLELREKEEKLRFFEQIEKINLGISRHRPFKPIEDETEEEQFVGPPTASGKRY